MNEVQDTLLTLLPPKQKMTPSGWLSVNAVCCHHRGERPDTKQRGGVKLTPDGGFTWHCFNCNFKAGWHPGHNLSSNTKMLFQWMGLSGTDIGKLNLIAMKLKEGQVTSARALNFLLEERKLPYNSKPITEWADSGCTDPDFLSVIDYLITQRRFGWDWYDWHWSDDQAYKQRIILPFYHNNKIVGWTGRKVVAGNPKYLADAQPSYVFNLDHQTHDRQFVIVTEGPFDAIAVDGVAIMHNAPSEAQIARINALGKEVIVVPDKDAPGAKLINTALEQNWHVSVPDWSAEIKDAADAASCYGRLYTLRSILHYKETNKVKIQIMKKKLESTTKDRNARL